MSQNKKTTCNLATLSSALDAYCRRYGYDHATALDQLITTTVHFFEWDTQSPTPTQATVLGGFASEDVVYLAKVRIF